MTWSTAIGYLSFVASVAFWFFLGRAFGRRFREHEQSMAALEQKWARENAEWAEQLAKWAKEDEERAKRRAELEAWIHQSRVGWCVRCGLVNLDGACGDSTTGVAQDCPHRDQQKPDDKERS